MRLLNWNCNAKMVRDPLLLPGESRCETVLVTGATGFIGRRLAARAAERGARRILCWGLCRSAFEAEGKAKLEHRGLMVLPVNLLSLSVNSSVGLSKELRTVYHLAAETNTALRRQSVNDDGTISLLRYLEPIKPGTHIVYTSSIAVHDNIIERQQGARKSVLCGKPLTPYGGSKLRAEEWLTAQARRQGFALSIVRPTTIIGEEPRPGTLWEVLRRKVSEGDWAVRLNWPGLTGFVHVDDVVEALLRIGRQPPPEGETRVYVLNGCNRTLDDVSKVIHSSLGAQYRRIPLPTCLWRVVCAAVRRALWCRAMLPTAVWIFLWRLHLVANNVFCVETRTLASLLERGPISVEEAAARIR